MAIAERFGKNENVFVFQPATLIQMLALPKGTEQEFIATQAAAGNPVESQSAREIQRNVKAFKQLRALKKLPDEDKLPTLQGLSLPLDAPNDTSPESSVTIVPETMTFLTTTILMFPRRDRRYYRHHTRAGYCCPRTYCGDL